MQGNVFISYRREDTAGYAGRLYDRLRRDFPGRVFIDTGEIPPGADFVETIAHHIEGCAALIALIGPNWTTNNRLQNPEDFVRLEIAGALKRNITVIPVLIGSGKLPDVASLPDELRPLLRHQAISIRDEDWEHGCERLSEVLWAALRPEPKASRTAIRLGLALAAVIIVTLLGWYRGKRVTRSTTPVPQLQVVRSRSPENAMETIWTPAWHDISWVGEDEGWLAGETVSGGGGGDIGTGVLLHTTDRGVTWTKIENERFRSGSGAFNWGSFRYTWQDIGPIYALHAYTRNLGGGKRQIEIWLAATSGVYHSEDDGQTWERSTPRPDDPKHPIPFAHFGDLFRIVASGEVYAVGWQGISYWSEANRAWELQFPTESFAISSVYAYPESPQWDVWAVAAKKIYHLSRPKDWKALSASGIEVLPRKGGLADIVLIDDSAGVAVGPDGTIVKGRKDNDGKWSWNGLAPKLTDKNLYSIAFDNQSKLCIVGSGGIVLTSDDRGQSWTQLSLKSQTGGSPQLNRVRFFGDSIWIVGNGVVYKAQK